MVAHPSVNRATASWQETLFVWGESDPFGGPDVGREALTHLQHGRLEIVGKGHLPWWDEPAECARRVREFVSGSG